MKRKPVKGARILLLDAKTGRLLIGLYTTGSVKKGMYGVPGGNRDAGEKAKTTAVRELVEEAGIKRRRIRLLPMPPLVQISKEGDSIILYFIGLCNNCVPKNTKEMNDLKWRTFEETLRLKKLYPPVRQALKQVKRQYGADLCCLVKKAKQKKAA